MGFLNPLLFTFSFFIGAFILLYFFRKQFETKMISSNLLWEQVMKEWEASPWLDKLQKNILFWLQLFSLLFLLFSLVRPIWHCDGLLGEKLIFIVDTSASMSATADGKSLLDDKKDQMENIIENLRNQSVTIILAGERPNIIIKDESSKNRLQQTIEQITLSYEHENIEQAIQLASALADENTALHLFTDGIAEEAVSELVKEDYIEVHNTEFEIQNAAITSFGVGTTGNTIGGIAIIENQSDQSMAMTFSVQFEDELIFEESLQMKGNEEKLVSIPDLPKADYYTAKIEADDDYSADNSWTAVYMNSSPTVYAAGDVNPFFVRGLDSIGVKVIQLNENDLASANPDGILLTDSLQLIKELSIPAIYTESGTLGNVNLTNKIEQKDDPLLEFVEMEGVFIQQTNTAGIGELETIVKSGDFPLIQKGQMYGNPVIAIRFPIEQSDWPLHPNFPIFLFNSYQWISQQTNYLGYFEPGEEKWVNLKTFNNYFEIFSEQGENLYSIDMNKENFRAPTKPGLYQSVSGEHIYYFSVILDDRERMVATSNSFILNQDQFQSEGNSEQIIDVLWFWLALCSFVILTIEWEVYRRYA